MSWQVIPREMVEMLNRPDRAAAERAVKAMLDMVKIDVETIRAAYEAVPAESR